MDILKKTIINIGVSASLVGGLIVSDEYIIRSVKIHKLELTKAEYEQIVPIFTNQMAVNVQTNQMVFDYDYLQTWMAITNKELNEKCGGLTATFQNLNPNTDEIIRIYNAKLKNLVDTGKC